jgi:hypothetical protein
VLSEDRTQVCQVQTKNSAQCLEGLAHLRATHSGAALRGDDAFPVLGKNSNRDPRQGLPSGLSGLEGQEASGNLASTE